MKNKSMTIVISIIIYFIIIFLYILARNEFILSPDEIYKNTFLFNFYILFSQFVIFYEEKRQNYDNYRYSFLILSKKIIKYNFIISTVVGLINYIIFNSLNIDNNVNFNILLLSIQLFLILVIILFFQLFLIFKTKSNNYIYFIILFVCILYQFNRLYADNLMFFSIFRYYFSCDNIMLMIFHYLLLLAIPIIFIYLKFLRKDNNYVKVRKYK